MMQRIRKWTCYWMTRTRKYRHAWRLSAFIIGVVISNSLAEYAALGSLMTFVEEEMGKSLVGAAAIINMKGGLTSLMAIIGSIISDAYLSRYIVVLVSVALSIFGLLLFTVSLPCGFPLFYPALVLIAMGEGGQEHTLRKFGTDQFKEHIEDESKVESHSRAWWYMGLFLGTLVGLFRSFFQAPTIGCMFWKNCDENVKEKAEWATSGMYSIIFMLVAYYVFVLGTLSYHTVMPGGSPFKQMPRVVVAAAKKRHLKWPEDESLIHGRQNPGGVASGSPNMNDEGEMHRQSGNSEENCNLAGDEIKSGLINDEQLRSCLDGSVCTGDDDACSSLPHKNDRVNPEDGSPAPNYSNDEMHGDDDCNDHTVDDDDDDDDDGDDDCNDHTGDDDDDDDDGDDDCNDHTGDDDGSPAPIYANDETHWLPHTNRLRCLDKATIITKPEAKEESKWRLCTQTEVEETKLFLCLFPIWVTFLMYGIVLSIGDTFFIEQASTLDLKLGRFEVPLTFLLAVSGFSELVVTQACIPLLNKLTRLKHGIPPKVRIGVGLLLSALCCFIASLIEKKRLNVVHDPSCYLDDDPSDLDDDPRCLPMSIFWLIPQFSVLGVMKGLVDDGIEDLFTDLVPKTMEGCEPVFSETVKGMGSILSAFALILINQLNRVGGRYRWFGPGIDDSHLDRYYAMLAGLSLINLFLYAIVSKAYHWQGT